MAPPSKIPAFFKFFSPEASSHILNVPLSFTLYLKGVLPDEVFLRDRNGNLWPVRVLKTGHDLFFADGWVKFIEDNDVSLGDFLVFQYNGSNVFDFKLLGTTACEKNSTAIKVKNEKRRGEYEEDEEGEIPLSENPYSVPKIRATRPSELPKSTQRPKEEEEEEEETDDENDDNKDYHESDKEEDVIDDDDDDEDIEVKKIDMAVVKKKSKSCRAHVKKLRKRTSIGTTGSKGARNKAVDIFKSGLIPLPPNPFFIARLRPRKRNELYIPYNVICDHNLEIPDEMIIRDKKGNKFVSRTSTWTDGRKVLTDGYRDFCMENEVKKKDRFLCEFLSHQELLIRVLHFRAGNWVLRP